MSRYPFYFALPPHATTQADIDAARAHVATKFDVHGPTQFVREDPVGGWVLHKILEPKADPVADAEPVMS